ncbi:MAG: cardiolipin synthase [Bacteroidaceae bacterium]|nr:cardiolipin synthase [Bacteroidaceae bacterium]
MRGCALFLFCLLFSCSISGQEATERVRSALRNIGCNEHKGCSIELLPSAREKYADMFGRIEEAQRFVHLEYFIFRKDSVGRILLNILSRKAQEGVEVRLLIDAYGNHKAPCPMTRADLDSIQAMGIDVRLFDPIHFPYIQNMYHRDHRKIVVVDGMWAWTGGMNVADYYVKGTRRTGPWRDMQVRVSGPVVDELESIFEHIWQKSSKTRLDTTRYRSQHADSSGVSIAVVNREPGRRSRVMRRAFAAVISAARDSIRIVNPYPTMTRRVERSLRKALRRKVGVEMMISSRMDTKITPDIVAIRMRKLQRRGAKVWLYDGGFHHTKTMTVDGKLCMVGTANLDGRSLRYDYEVSLVAYDSLTTQYLDSIFDDDLKDSELMTRKVFRRRYSPWHRFIGRLMQPVRNVF